MAYYECIGNEDKYKPVSATLTNAGVLNVKNQAGQSIYTQTFTNTYNGGYNAGLPDKASQVLYMKLGNSFSVVSGGYYFDFCPEGGHICTAGGSLISSDRNVSNLYKATSSTMRFNANVYLWRIK